MIKTNVIIAALTWCSASPTPFEQTSEKRPIEFNDLFSGQFSSSTTSSYTWISANEYLTRSRDSEGNCIFNKNLVEVVDGQFETSTSKFADCTKYDDPDKQYSSYLLSKDAKYIAYRSNYIKKWRHSYIADYDIYELSTEMMLSSLNSVQYFTFSKNSDMWAYVKDNNIFITDRNGGHFDQQVTFNGEKEKIFNGIPDWVYEEEVVGTNNMLYWSPNDQFIAYVVTDDTKVDHILYQTYGESNQIYSGMEDIAYPKPSTTNPSLIIHVVDLSRLFSNDPDNQYDLDESSFEVFSWAPASDNYVLKDIYWFEDVEDDRLSFIAYWMDRIQTESTIIRYRMYGFDNEPDFGFYFFGWERKLVNLQRYHEFKRI